MSHPLGRFGGQYKIIHLVGRNRRVLDIGCGAGVLDRQLVANGCIVDGVEIDEGAAREALDICNQVFVGDIEAPDGLKLEGQQYDVIVLSHVLEHMRRPDLVLKKLKGHCRSGGKIIAVVPNICYLPSRIKLMMGRFDYEDTGNFDRTHLRFFTRKTARRLIEEAGYKIESYGYTGPAAIVPLFPGLTAIAFVIVASPMTAEDGLSKNRSIPR